MALRPPSLLHHSTRLPRWRPPPNLDHQPGGSERGAAGKGNGSKETPLVELEGEYGKGSGWGEAHSRLAVGELQEWLSPSDQMLARSSSYDNIHWGLHEWLFPGSESSLPQSSAEHHNQIPLPSSYELGVEKGGSRPDKRPWFVIEQARCKEAFTQLPIWNGTTTNHPPVPSSVLRNGREKRAGGGGSTLGGWRATTRMPRRPRSGRQRTCQRPWRKSLSPVRKQRCVGPRLHHPMPQARDRDKGGSTSSLNLLPPWRGGSSTAADSRQIPGPKELPVPRVLFGHLRPVPVDRAVDPNGDRCFICWARGHTRFICREPRRLFCFNCGRRNVTIRNFSRCSDEHLSYLRGTRYTWGIGRENSIRHHMRRALRPQRPDHRPRPPPAGRPPGRSHCQRQPPVGPPRGQTPQRRRQRRC